jgi:transcriptional regulator with XRE-family HTH domain
MDRQQRKVLGAKIREAYKGTGWTQEQFATKAGVPLRTISSLVRGERIPQLETIEAAMRALGLEPDPAEVEESWPADVKLFLNVMGLYLMARPAEERGRIMTDIAEAIFRTD